MRVPYLRDLYSVFRKIKKLKCSHSLMDRVRASEARDAGSIPVGSTTKADVEAYK